MTTFRLCLGAALVAAGWTAASSPPLAQIKTDGTVGPRTELKGPHFRIEQELGKRIGDNLFHSFEEFNIRTLADGKMERATFRGASDIANVISRVTGASPSEINGVLRSEVGKADVWLINPNGVTFGPNAQLDVPGSFHVSTADQLRFADGAVFSALDPHASTLSVAPPEAFGFLGDSPSDILVSGGRLQVFDGETVSLSSGRIDIRNARVEAPEGRVLLTTQTGAGQVRASSGRPSTPPSGTIEIASALVDTSGDGGGDIRINAGRLAVHSALIAAENTGAEHSLAAIEIHADQVALNFGASIRSSTRSSGNAGEIGVRASRLEVKNGATIDASTFAEGRAGDIQIDVNRLAVSGSPTFSDTGLLTDAAQSSTGDAGVVNIRAGGIDLRQGGIVSASTFGRGDGGKIEVSAHRMTISGDARLPVTGVLADAERGSTGDGGEMSLTFHSLRLLNGGEIRSSVAGTGEGGSIRIDALGEISIAGRNATGVASGIVSEIPEGGVGRKGSDITLNARLLELSEGGKIRSVTEGSGDGGSVNVFADRVIITEGGQISSSTLGEATGGSGDVRVEVAEDIRISGEDGSREPEEPSGIFASTESAALNSGAGGSVSVAAPVITLQDRAEIASETFGTGPGGRVRVTATEALTINGAEITAKTEDGGSGGEIRVRSHDLRILNQGEISSATRGSGAAGSIIVKANSIAIESSGIVDVTTFGSGEAGSILLKTGKLVVSGKGADSTTPTGILSDVEIMATTAIAGGAITVIADEVKLRDGGEIRSSAFGPGDGGPGPITIEVADRLVVAGTGEILDSDNNVIRIRSRIASELNEGSSATLGGNVTIAGNRSDIVVRDDGLIRSVTESTGRAGSVDVDARRLTLTRGGQISSSSLEPMDEAATGKSGDVTATAGESIEIRGESATFMSEEGTPEPSGIFGSMENKAAGSGDGGSVNVSAPRISLHDRGEIGSETFGTGTGGQVFVEASDRLLLVDAEITAESTRRRDGGDAGSITIRNGRVLELTEGGLIKTRARSADGGQITISVGELIDLAESEITTEVGGDGGDGGNIRIDPRFLVLDRSVIRTDAAVESAGDIRIVADNLIRSPDSVTSARGGPAGIDGRIIIQTAEADLVGDLAELPATFLVSERLFDQSCAARSGQPVSSLQRAGRGGLPQMPDAPLGAVLLADKLPTASSGATGQAARAREITGNLAAVPSLTLLDCR